MIFERIAVIDRLAVPPLPSNLNAKRDRLRVLHPEWSIADGEQAHFSIWSGTQLVDGQRPSATELKELNPDQWADRLAHDDWNRDVLLSAWRELARTDFTYVLEFLLDLDAAHDPFLPELWSYGLQGMRERAKNPLTRDSVLGLILGMPQVALDDPRVSAAAADLVESASDSEDQAELGADFWRAFDRVLPAVALDPSNAEEAGDGGWVSLAINRSMGRLATAFLNALFARRVQVGKGLPDDLVARFGNLLKRSERTHLPARIIAASRLSYLFAVDPEWTSDNLLPSFSWENETESRAAWAGYAWHPRIDLQLWHALKPAFIASFGENRILGLDRDAKKFLVQLLPLVRIEFGDSELSSNFSRGAIRSLPIQTRTELASWIASYVDQSASNEIEGGLQGDVDAIWTQRVGPWVHSVWPPERDFRTPGVSKQLAAAAISTHAAFPLAVDTIEPLMMPASAGSTLKKLSDSRHPTQHPEAALRLLNLLISQDEPIYDLAPLRNIVDRIRLAEPGVTGQVAFRSWDDYLRMRGA